MTELDNGYASKYGTLTSPLGSLRDSAPSPPMDPHYEHIPAQLGSVGVRFGSECELLDKAEPPPKVAETHSPKAGGLQKSGQYDKLEVGGKAKENPYVTSPNGSRRREMYSLLPSPTQLKKMANSYNDSDA